MKVLYKSLLKPYQRATDEYKTSNKFQNAINHAETLIKTEPLRKYSHIKYLCEELWGAKAKKRANLVTLDKAGKRKGEFFGERGKRKIPCVINSNDSNIINLDEIEDTIVIREDKENEDQNQDQAATNLLEVNYSVAIPEEIINESEILAHQKLLRETQIKERIKLYETEISKLKLKIDKLEEQEVKLHDTSSAYIRSEKMKARVVQYYKKLCELTGAEVVKRREVTLKIRDGKCASTVKVLEDFLNSNIGDDGYPPFPNFNDVLKCVVLANDKYNLGWDHLKIGNEAKGLFIQCGRTLQALRQKREWIDLISRVKEDIDDPADRDADLSAKLEANRKLGIKNESELLERYAKMENQVHSSKMVEPGTLYDIEMKEHSSSSDEFFDNHNNTEKNKANNQLDLDRASEVIAESELKIKNEIKLEQSDIIEKLEALGDDFTTSVFDIEDPFLVVEISSDTDDDDDVNVIENSSKSTDGS
ncbi:unnamed protein product [Leptidea sinapis]|uniref:Daxx histone-binding domain-containing protein n=1 Tax=Leptidea sinapis TaxID=189913 RepID=A0A5E4QJV5_9NEOP|nr:unnamed protein product [Leptidea sinapis]